MRVPSVDAFACVAWPWWKILPRWGVIRQRIRCLIQICASHWFAAMMPSISTS